MFQTTNQIWTNQGSGHLFRATSPKKISRSSWQPPLHWRQLKTIHSIWNTKDIHGLNFIHFHTSIASIAIISAPICSLILKPPPPPSPNSEHGDLCLLLGGINSRESLFKRKCSISKSIKFPYITQHIAQSGISKRTLNNRWKTALI